MATCQQLGNTEEITAVVANFSASLFLSMLLLLVHSPIIKIQNNISDPKTITPFYYEF
jgi:hypothetical protein